MADGYEYIPSSLLVCHGSTQIVSGFAGDCAPRAVFPNVVGRPLIPAPGVLKKDYYVGDEAFSKRTILKLSNPIVNGFIANWDDMEKVWQHCFLNELRVAPEEHTLMLSDPPLTPRADREKMTQVFFETFNVPGLYIANKAALALYASGRTTGVVIQSGSTTNIVPIYEGSELPHATRTMPLGGQDVSHTLEQMMAERGLTFTSLAEKELVHDIKHKLGYIALDYKNELLHADTVEKSYEMPDGQVITVGTERFRCAEQMFVSNAITPECKQRVDEGTQFKLPQPIRNIVSNYLETEGVQKLLDESIQACDADIRKELYQNIVLAGGNTMFEGFAERLEHEMRNTSSILPGWRIKIVAPPERKYSVWIGASILSSLSTFQQCWTTRAEYDEVGATIVHRKCF